MKCIIVVTMIISMTHAQLPYCTDSKIGNDTCSTKNCTKSGLFQNNECTCSCCNGLSPFCDENCYKESSVKVCYQYCNCRKPGLEQWCVSTQWLRRNGFKHGELYSAGAAFVLCPTHLGRFPCATAGHLLRVNGALMSYKQLCGRGPRARCESRVLRVSRLRHSIDWSVVRQRQDDGTVIELTSLSGNEAGADLAVAKLTHALIAIGLGGFCDFIQQVVIFTKSMAIATLRRGQLQCLHTTKISRRKIE